MKSTEHETWTEYHWEAGDLVRLKKARGGDAGSWDHAPEGSFGRIIDARDGYHMRVSLHGFSMSEDSIAGLVSYVSRFDLVPWEREPRDEPAIAANALAVLKSLAWMSGTTAAPQSGTLVALSGVGLSDVYPRPHIRTNHAVLSNLMPYLGDGTGTVDRLVGSDLSVNAEGHAFLDRAGAPRSRSLAGGGNLYDLSYDRIGTFHVRDVPAGRDHVFEGEAAQRLLAANRTEVKWLSDGKMADIVRKSLDFPRTLRSQPREGVLVIETGPSEVDVRYGDDQVVLDGEGADLVRRACARNVHLDRWMHARPELFEAPEPEGPSFR